MFANIGVLKQYQHVSFMAASIYARKEIDSLRSGAGKACWSRRPRWRGKGWHR